MKIVGLLFVTIVCVVLEASVIRIPFLLVLLLLTTVFFRKEWVFLFAIGGGILLDSLTFRTIGSSSLLFVCLLGLVSTYERKFEIQSLPFMLFGSGVGSAIYFFFFPQEQVIMSLVLTLLLAACGFFLISFLKSSKTASF